MKRSFLGRLQRTALLNLVGALLLLLVVPGLQLLVLDPQGYGDALNTFASSLAWIHVHILLFLLYRVALLAGFALLLGLPFALFRIIVAQEIVGRELQGDDAEEDEEEEDEEELEDEGEEDDLAEDEREDAADPEAEEVRPALEANGMPGFAWRGKGFAVLAAWAGLVGLILLVGGTLASTLYLWSSAGIISATVPLPENFAAVSSLFAVLSYTIGDGLLALSCIFFGIAIARSGRRLWPDSWVFFAYAGIAIGAISSGSAVQVALSPTGGQSSLTTPAILLFALWSLWFGLVVARLKAE